jgi:hypothetical protein
MNVGALEELGPYHNFMEDPMVTSLVSFQTLLTALDYLFDIFKLFLRLYITSLLSSNLFPANEMSRVTGIKRCIF